MLKKINSYIINERNKQFFVKKYNYDFKVQPNDYIYFRILNCPGKIVQN